VRIGRWRILVLGMLVAVTAFPGRSESGNVSWRRLSQEPILSPGSESWQSVGTFNPAVVERDGKFVMLYRAQDASGTSRLGYAESKDGIHFKRNSDP